MTPLDVCGLNLILNMKPKDSSCYLSILYVKNQECTISQNIMSAGRKGQ